MAAIEDIPSLKERAAEVAVLLRLVANERRLQILCLLLSAPGMTVTDLSASVGLSQSAMSQHLAKLRADGLVARRRSGQCLHYRVSDERVRALLTAIAEVFCPEILADA